MERFARRCDATGKGMNEGFCIGDGEMYFINGSDAEVHIKKMGYETLDEAYEDGVYYYTEWEVDQEIEEQGYYYTEDGKEINI